jgi:hypothetical protein
MSNLLSSTTRVLCFKTQLKLITQAHYPLLKIVIKKKIGFTQVLIVFNRLSAGLSVFQRHRVLLALTE